MTAYNSWWLHCDHGRGQGLDCDATIEESGLNLTEMRRIARKAGWAVSNGKDICPQHRQRRQPWGRRPIPQELQNR